MFGQMREGMERTDSRTERAAKLIKTNKKLIKEHMLIPASDPNGRFLSSSAFYPLDFLGFA